MLAMAVADGRLVPEEKKQLHDYRERHSIPLSDHVECLDQAGWSLEEYDNGAKMEKLWPQNLKRLSHFLEHGEEAGVEAGRPSRNA